MNAVEANLVVRSHQEGLVQGNVDVAYELYAEDFVNYSLGLPEALRHGPGAIRSQYAYLNSAFSDMEIENHTPTAEGEYIGVRWIWKGRHTGNFLGIPPTNARIEIVGFDILQIRDGKIRAAWIIQDGAGMMAQIQAALAAHTA